MHQTRTLRRTFNQLNYRAAATSLQMVRLPASTPVATMAHLSFGVNEVVVDALSDIIGKRYGIRHMADEMAANLDRW